MSKNKHTAEWHLKQAWKMMNEISTLPGDQGARFLLLKKKAQKHVERAKEIDPNAKIFAQKLNVPKNIQNKITKN